MVVEIQVIYGGAGCGKTQRLVNLAVEAEKMHKTFILLAPTHSSKQNLYNRFIQLKHPLDKEKFQTTFSYFRINWEENDVIGPKIAYNVVFIDEFGLIKKELFKKMMSKLNVLENNVKVIIAGDVVQLSPIYVEKVRISFSRLNRDYEKVPAYVSEHDYKSLFSLKSLASSEKELLLHNYRSDSNVLQLIHEIFYDMNISNMQLLDLMRVVYLIVHEGYTFISAKYEQHELIYKLMKQQIANKTVIGDLAFYEGSEFMAIENNGSVHNGDILKYVYADKSKAVYFEREDAEIVWRNNFKLIPAQLLTSHKSQGLSISKVIVCIDDMFDISMFYTMCTRAMNDLKFFTFQKSINSEELMSYLQKFHDLLKFYKYIE